MNKKTTVLKKSKKEHTKVSHKKVHKKKKTTKNKNENKNVNKNIITINGTGSSGGGSGSIPIPIPFHSSPSPAQPINIFNEPPMERYLPIKQEPIDIKKELPLPVKQDTPVKSPVKSPFDEIENKVDTPTKVHIDNDIKKRNRVFIEPKTTPVSVNPSDLSNSSIISQMLNQKNNNDLNNLVPLNASKSLSNIINNETYDIDQNEKFFSNPFKMYDSDTSNSSISNQSKKSNTLSQFYTPTIDNIDYNNDSGEKWFDNPLKFYNSDTSISSITKKSNKSTDKSNKSTDNRPKPITSIEEYKENQNRDIDDYIRRLEQNIEPIKPKRHRRTKEQMIVFREEQAKIKAEKERIRQEKLADFERKAKIFFDKYG
jgi:hypothetical protein